MPHFSYEISDRSGRKIKQTGTFPSVNDLFSTVRSRGDTLLGYHQKRFPALPKLQKKLKRPILAEFFRNLALLLKGGVPLREALTDMVLPPCHPTLKEIFDKVGYRIDGGLLFSEALQGASNQIPQIILPLISIGEETGQLDRTLKDGADHLDRLDRIISSTRRALVYPSVVMFAMFAALAFWMIFVLPQLMDLFTTMGVTELPLATRILIKSIDISNAWWPVIPILVSIFFLFYILSQKNNKVHYWWDQLWMHVPLVRNIVRSSQLAFFFEYTSMLTDSGVTILRSLELMEVSVKNQILKRSIRTMQEKISAGETISESISSLGFFEPFVMRMVRVGEQTGNMPEQLDILAKYYMDKVDKLVAALSKTLEPLIIAVAGVIFSIIAMGLLGPIYNMISQISS